MNKRNTEGLSKYTKERNEKTIDKVNSAINKLKRSNVDSINFSTVAKEAGVSKATLYNNDVLKERILGLRTTTKGVINRETPILTQIDRTTKKGYLDEIRKLRKDKEKLILQLVEMDAIREENSKLKERLENQKRKDGYIL
ncbi:MAG: DUF6262 family protein [Clostridia bacterium]